MAKQKIKVADERRVFNEKCEEEFVEVNNTPGGSYGSVTLCATKILTCFGSTYVRESAFSTMGRESSSQNSATLSVTSW